MSARRNWWTPGLVFILALLYLWPVLERFSGLADEGIDLTWADRMASGQVPYRDFFMFLPPLTPATLAASFALLGNCVLTARIWLWLMRAGYVTLGFLLARRMMPSAYAGLAAAMILVTTPEPVNYLHHWSGSFFFMLGLLVLDYSRRPGFGLALGFALGLSWMALPNLGTALGLAMIVSQLVEPRWKQAPLAIGGLLLSFLPVAIYLVGHGALAGFRADVFDYNLAREKQDHVPFGAAFDSFAQALHSDPVYLGLLVLLALALIVPPFLWRGQPAVKVLWSAVLASLLVTVYRILPSQVLLHSGPALVLAAWVLSRARQHWLGALAASCVAVELAVTFAHMGGADTPVDFPRGRLYSSRSEARDQNALVQFLSRKGRAAGASVFLPYVPNLFYLMDSRNAIPYDTWVPGFHGWRSPSDYQKTLGVLLQTPDPVIFIFPAFQSAGFCRGTWPSLPPDWMAAQYADLDAWLRQHYAFENHGAVLLYRRKP